jgi:hypothetical protein
LIRAAREIVDKLPFRAMRGEACNCKRRTSGWWMIDHDIADYMDDIEREVETVSYWQKPTEGKSRKYGRT